ncbi:LexA family protein [Pseudomonas aeruginosa]|uniref:LexA family protein n=1 Tax=Pseudomonas aeruginosa group TaxID=136841 RepID=UPI0004537F87|nr:translesion error-prone DNA polymerase V autoproteolytic subunit [Pseudomonas aeruginosa]EIU2716160.1 translesion error-prone DNA polymerase V autoproteolytic subunit [Pseudomonas aeruginosa]EIU2862979.1 translesion error-prone DNA polymerase V autoproteolytic subunit [Pseudomonas aeruginosa]ELD5773058.1 translesion error-prone DNA polymerase V autoproteolytic subunit [Pseudomonas aeruginosa]ETV55847.1 hypothetical protein Q042_05256 [Pseudomonas aeruginosa BWHPSA037]MBA5210096.1 translesio
MNATLLSHLTFNHCAQLLAHGGQVSCGFPSPAADYQVPDLSLDALVGLTPTSSMFLFRAWGHSMTGAGIYDGDVLIVDRAAKASPGKVVVAVVGAEFLVKRLAQDASGRLYLHADNPSHKPITLADDEILEVWGVCRWNLHCLD